MALSSSGRRRLFTIRHPVVVDVGCSCRKAKLSSLFSSTSAIRSKKPAKAKPNPQTPSNHRHPLSSYYPFSPSATGTTTWDNSSSRNPSSASTTATSPYDDYYYNYCGYGYSDGGIAGAGKGGSNSSSRKPAARGSCNGGRVAEESVPVVKESADPYHDFRDSMLQMIVEKEIYAWDDLRDLLNRFLSLNSPYHHDSIVRAFGEIWNGIFCSSSGGADAAGIVAAYTSHGGGSRRKKRQQHGHHYRLSRDPPDYGVA